MKLYDWDEIKQAGDCRDFCGQVLGMKPKSRGPEWTSFDNPWRTGSDSGAFSVCRGGYNDHVSKETGSILDLCANAKFNGDMWQAQEWLGDYLHLTPKNEAKERRKIVKAYDYVDAEGKLLHQTVRFQPKEFRQRRPDPEKTGEWIWGLGKISPVLYRLPDLIKAPGICIVGGEKDADSLCDIGFQATTNPMGEGNWKDHYNEFFRDKHVIIIPDRDEVGRLHAKTISYGVHALAKSIRLVALPFPEDASPAKDITDWLTYWRGKGKDEKDIIKDLREIIHATEPTDKSVIEKPTATQGEITAAKKANKAPFTNYHWENQVNDKGEEKPVKRPRHINEMVDDIHVRFWEFPRRIGTLLFDHDRANGSIRNLDDESKVFSWINEKSGHNVEWANVGGITKKEFFHSVYNNSQRYEIISGVPNWPPRTDVYYTHDALPQSTPDAKYLNEFVNFFEPESEHDWHLIRAFIASPLYYKPSIQRPMWVIDSDDGQGVGKSRLVELVAALYGSDAKDSGQPFSVEHASLNNEMTSQAVFKRLLSDEGRKKRIVLIDNVTGYFKSSSLATLVTQSSISGMKPYGHGEETRPNDLTYVITANRCTLDRDLVDRSFVIKVKRPEKSRKDWEKSVLAFIHKHRLQVIADVIAILEKGPQYEVNPMSRFKTWEHDVLCPILGTLDIHEEVSKQNHERRVASDGDVIRQEIIEDFFAEKLQNLGINADKETVFIQSQVAIEWAKEASPGIGGHTDIGIGKVLNELSATYMNGRLSTPKNNARYKGKRGYWWHKDVLEIGMTTNPDVIVKTVEGVIKRLL